MMESEWVSAKESQPVIGERVLITDGTVVGEGYLGYHRDCLYWFRCYGVVCVWEVTHWKPMPKPPKGEKQNETESYA